jgi:CAAX prenyl protease-like protein
VSSQPLREEQRGIPFPAVARVAPFALFIALLALESPIGDVVGDTRWLAVLRPIAVAGVLALFWKHYTELHGTIRIAPRHLVLAAALGVAAFATWIAFDRGWAALGTPRPGFAPVDADGRLDLPLAALRLAGFGLVVPVMEELFWRSFLLRWIERPRDFLAVDPRRVAIAPFVLTSLLFASEHALWFAGLVAGISYTLVYMRSRNLWAAVLSHAITNTTLGAWILATGNWRFW